MKAVPVLRRRVVVAEDAYVDLVVWRLGEALPTSTHAFKYRLAYVVDSRCVVLYDNERGKGDHRHFGQRQSAYRFSSIDQLLEDFNSDVSRWNRENGRA